MPRGRASDALSSCRSGAVKSHLEVEQDGEYARGAEGYQREIMCTQSSAAFGDIQGKNGGTTIIYAAKNKNKRKNLAAFVAGRVRWPSLIP